jgi:hypothetical protein
MDDPNAKDYIADTGMSKAETLSIELRVMRLKKMHRRKDLIEALKAKGDDTDDLDERGNKILKKTEYVMILHNLFMSITVNKLRMY